MSDINNLKRRKLIVSEVSVHHGREGAQEQRNSHHGSNDAQRERGRGRGQGKISPSKTYPNGTLLQTRFHLPVSTTFQ
jgi:hypothetical protein